jgi:hypothetical protein
MALSPGEQRSFEVIVTNEGTQTLRARAELSDLQLDRLGVPLLEAAGSSRWSAAPWVTIAPQAIALPPGERQRILCRVQVPQGGAGGRYGAILITAQGDAKPEAGGMRVQPRVGTLVLLTLIRTQRRGADVESLQVRPAQENGLEFTAALRNTGNVHFHASGELIVRDATGRSVGRVKFEGGTGAVLPDGLREFAGRWTPPHLGPHSYGAAYVAEARFSAPGLRTATETIEFTLPLDTEAQAGASGDSSIVEAGEETEK